jgi:CO/xanthine dehydrogenase Mo-binding subunit
VFLGSKVNHCDLSSAGAGETGNVGMTSAMGNTIFAATGIRLRNMPMIPRVMEAKEQG